MDLLKKRISWVSDVLLVIHRYAMSFVVFREDVRDTTRAEAHEDIG